MPSKVIDYSFDVKSILNPIENLVNESGCGDWFKYYLEGKHLIR